ncbi:DUF899 domain-containing protein [Amycolatopsis sp. OK19-0408]|uniref:DUF899 domain-containing protein n=1 Tax=Amycolatopsis iheyensis TaxID=2945988 RepID=A0A9X2NAB9_9PSEU|nr:DUF899 domain-containing protein [Amycolatopsis iheyensis]MCR6483542.1 DUF899 domain-containing protein [Amycolatopsis iheyensis]
MTELLLPALGVPKPTRPRTVPATAYEFIGPAGPVTLAGLADGHRRLAVYHTMPCRSHPGAAVPAERIAAALHAAGTRLVIVSRAPYEKVEQYGRHFGWGLPVYSAVDTGFDADFPATGYLAGPDRDERDEVTGLSFFARDRAAVWHLGSTAVPCLDFLELADVAGERRGR